MDKIIQVDFKSGTRSDAGNPERSFFRGVQPAANTGLSSSILAALKLRDAEHAAHIEADRRLRQAQKKRGLSSRAVVRLEEIRDEFSRMLGNEGKLKITPRMLRDELERARSEKRRAKLEHWLSLIDYSHSEFYLMVDELARLAGLSGAVLVKDEERADGHVMWVEGKKDYVYIDAWRLGDAKVYWELAQDDAVLGMAYLLMHERGHLITGEHLWGTRPESRPGFRKVEGGANREAWRQILFLRTGSGAGLKEEFENPRQETLEMTAKGYALLQLMTLGVFGLLKEGEFNRIGMRSSFPHLNEDVFERLFGEAEKELALMKERLLQEWTKGFV